MQTYETLTYINERGEQTVFGIGSHYHVNVQKDVDGLADLASTIYSTSSMGQNGSTYQGYRIEPREIEIEGKMYGADKGEQYRLRRELLKILNPELSGTLYYQYGDFIRKIWAKVKGSPTFSHPDLYERFVVRFECLDPFWHDEADRRSAVAQWIGAWEFPTEIELNNPNDMIFGYREDSVIVHVQNDGDTTCGMKIIFTADGVVEDPELYNTQTGEYMRILTTMQAGDVITVDTRYGSKTITLTRDGSDTNLYQAMDVNSTFMQLGIGDNVFRYNAASGLSNLEAMALYSQNYLGV